MRLFILDKWQNLIDILNGRKADIITTVLYLILAIFATLSLIKFKHLINNPVGDDFLNPNYGLLILLSLLSFLFSQISDYYKEPSRKVPQFIYVVTCISIFSLIYFANLFNSVFINILSNTKNIEVIPADLLIGNIRVVTFFVPLSIIVPISMLTLNVIKNADSKKKLKELEINALLPTVHKSDDTTIDIEICKDANTGLPCIVPEKVLYEHLWLQGGTGSGKTSNILLPYEEQLFFKKSYLTFKLKETAFYCLKNNIARINIPISNNWFNENFDMDLIEPVEGKEEDFIKAFEKYTIGVRNNDEVIFKDTITNSKEIEIDSIKNPAYFYEIKTKIKKNNMQIYSKTLLVKKGEEEFNIELNGLGSINSITEERCLHLDVDENKADFIINNNMSKILKINFSINKDFVLDVLITLKGNGKIIPKNLGITVIAPDGDLISNTANMAKKYGIKIHKIDPFMEEIKKGGIAKFNPLIGDSPEKIGDIVASILVSMEVGESSKINPYFTNASVRAVRNLVILLKVAHPILKGKEPTLDDVLNCLNDFNRVKPYVEILENDIDLKNRWSSVIDYFKASFMDPPNDHSNTAVTSSKIGSQKKKTQEAISGIINQLDNLLGREEIRYILCDPDESINLSQVLNKGECIGISTRQGNLGPRLGRAFALFFILSLQNEVLSRYAENENPEIPHFLIIDEFPMYCNENTETFFTFARKYKCSVTIAIQNIGQLKKVSDEFGETIFTNTTTKLLLPKSNIEDRKYWSEFFGNTNKMEIMTGVSTNSMHADNPSYSEQVRGSMKETKNITEDEINNLNFQQLFYSYTNNKGRQVIGKGSTDFVELREEPFMSKQFDFEKYCISEDEYTKIKKEKDIIAKYKKAKKAEDSIIKIVNNTSDGTLLYEEDFQKNTDINTDNFEKDHPSNSVKPTDLFETNITEENTSNEILSATLELDDTNTKDNDKDDIDNTNVDINEKQSETESTQSFDIDDETFEYFTREE